MQTKVSGLRRKDIFSMHGISKVSSIKNHNSRLWVWKFKSSTSAPCRQKIKDALKIIMSGNEKMLNTFIQEFREEFMSLPPEEIAYPKKLNGLSKFSDPNQLFAKIVLPFMSKVVFYIII